MGLIGTAILMWFLSTPATLENGVCSACKKWHVTSTAQVNAYGACTAMGCGGAHWDELGTFHPAEPCNTCTFIGQCSRGHVIVVSFKR